MMNYENMGWGMWFGWIAGLLFIILILWIISRIIHKPNTRNEIDTAREILRNRFAAGEISKSEFDEKLKELS